jgi:hypothetical protein
MNGHEERNAKQRKRIALARHVAGWGFDMIRRGTAVLSRLRWRWYAPVLFFLGDLLILVLTASVDSSGVEWYFPAFLQGPLAWIPHPQWILESDAYIVAWFLTCGSLFWGPIAFLVGWMIEWTIQDWRRESDG